MTFDNRISTATDGTPHAHFRCNVSSAFCKCINCHVRQPLQIHKSKFEFSVVNAASETLNSRRPYQTMDMDCHLGVPAIKYLLMRAPLERVLTANDFHIFSIFDKQHTSVQTCNVTLTVSISSSFEVRFIVENKRQIFLFFYFHRKLFEISERFRCPEYL